MTDEQDSLSVYEGTGSMDTPPGTWQPAGDKEDQTPEYMRVRPSDADGGGLDPAWIPVDTKVESGHARQSALSFEGILVAVENALQDRPELSEMTVREFRDLAYIIAENIVDSL